MKVVGIIAEYNPFHLGHAYQLQYAREVLGADYCLVVMSGPFTQRGTPALFDKYTRASFALKCGADLVLELPVIYATASAEAFALGGISALHNTGVVDTLLFGCETSDISSLQEIASILVEEPEEYKHILQSELQQGKSYAAARASALNHPKYQSIISSPNNILAVEYLKALKRLDSPVQPVGLKRKGNGYHDDTLQSHIASATAIRKFILEQNDFTSESACRKMILQLPESLQKDVLCKLQAGEFLSSDNFSLLLHYALMSATDFSSISDCNEDISNKILRNRHAYASFDSFCQQLKSKNVTHSRISRILCHILLGIRDNDVPVSNTNISPSDIVPYLRILGFNQRGSAILSEIKAKGAAPLLTTPKDTENCLPPKAQSMLQKDIFASDVYRMVLSQKTGSPLPNEYTRKFSPQQI